jgi:hypothetical protein
LRHWSARPPCPAAPERQSRSDAEFGGVLGGDFEPHPVGQALVGADNSVQELFGFIFTLRKDQHLGNGRK